MEDKKIITIIILVFIILISGAYGYFKSTPIIVVDGNYYSYYRMDSSSNLLFFHDKSFIPTRTNMTCDKVDKLKCATSMAKYTSSKNSCMLTGEFKLQTEKLYIFDCANTLFGVQDNIWMG